MAKYSENDMTKAIKTLTGEQIDSKTRAMNEPTISDNLPTFLLKHT